MSKRKKRKATLASQIAKRLSNKYGVVTLIFVVWVGFLDKHDLITKLKLKSTIADLEQQVERNMDLVEVAKREKIEIEQNMEKYAREKYYMHKEGEDVLIIDTKSETITQ